MKSYFLRSTCLAAGLLLPFASHAINVDSLAQVEAKEMGRLPKCPNRQPACKWD